MAKLLKASQLKKMKNVFQDLGDTFSDRIVEYKRYGKSRDRFKENNKPDQVLHLHKIPVLVVEYSDKSDADFMHNEGAGGTDFGEGYMLCLITELIKAGLVTADEKEEFIGKANTDYIVLGMEEVRVVGFKKVGQLDKIDFSGTENTAARIFWRRKQKDG